jgi:hypothetical protein
MRNAECGMRIASADLSQTRGDAIKARFSE